MEQKEKGNTSQQKTKIQWHPAFCAAAEIELRENKNELDFCPEYNLSKKPLQIDLLIVEKRGDIPIINEVGHIFKRYNVIEYKSPDDGMTIDDFFKTVAYAYLYKSLGETVDQIPLKELIVSLFREINPRKMMQAIVNSGCEIEKYAEGIYYVKGLLIPAQIVVMSELRRTTHSPFRVLSKDAKKEDIREFLERAGSFTEPGEREKADAVIQVSVSANKEKYEEIRRDSIMCEALRTLMKDEIEEELQKARKESRKEGREQGENRLSTLYKKLLQDGRQEEIPHMMDDAKYREQLYEEYRID
ncbi:MAG: hypothetical protein ACI4EI_12945 [Muricoprocola sp.]